MKTQFSKQWVGIVIAAVVSVVSVGCSTSGAKQEPVIAHKSASRDIKGSVADTDSHVQEVFKDMGIMVTASQAKNSGQEQDVTGTAGDKTVNVQMMQLSDGMTHIEITAKEGTFQWNQDYAQSVLSQVIAKSS